MAGYLFGIGKKNKKPDFKTLHDCIKKGVYSTLISQPKKAWLPHHEGTFADYCSMKEGDNVYFFIDRKIYGIGKLVNINGDCKFLNYPNSNYPSEQKYSQIKSLLLYNNGKDSPKNRFLCTFEPFPYFFTNGVDMDEVLSSAPEKFKILRAFWKLSFIKFPESENQAFKDILLRRNIEAIKNPDKKNTFEEEYKVSHEYIRNKTKNNKNYKLTLAPFLSTICTKKGALRHEMAIEAAIIYQLSNNLPNTVRVFGKWDYISHQVIASPFKPIDYMDKMDLFGYRYLNSETSTISDYLVVEIKKGKINSQDILQLMKYVDWIKNDYAYGDYTMIQAFMVGNSYTKEALTEYSNIIERKFIKGVRPSVSTEWKNVKLVEYKFNLETNFIDFKDITPSKLE